MTKEKQIDILNACTINSKGELSTPILITSLKSNGALLGLRLQF